MPYKKNSDINKNKRKGMTSHGQTIYRKAFNSALKHYGDEGTAHAVANHAVTAAKERKVKSESSEFSSIVEEVLQQIPIKPPNNQPVSCEFWRGDGFCGVNALLCPHLDSTYRQCKVRESALYASKLGR